MRYKIGMSYSAVGIAVTLLLFASGPSVVDHQAQAQMSTASTIPGDITSGGIPGGTFTGSTRTAEIPCDDL